MIEQNPNKIVGTLLKYKYLESALIIGEKNSLDPEDFRGDFNKIGYNILDTLKFPEDGNISEYIEKYRLGHAYLFCAGEIDLLKSELEHLRKQILENKSELLNIVKRDIYENARKNDMQTMETQEIIKKSPRYKPRKIQLEVDKPISAKDVAIYTVDGFFGRNFVSKTYPPKQAYRENVDFDLLMNSLKFLSMDNISPYKTYNIQTFRNLRSGLDMYFDSRISKENENKMNKGSGLITIEEIEKAPIKCNEFIQQNNLNAAFDLYRDLYMKSHGYNVKDGLFDINGHFSERLHNLAIVAVKKGKFKLAMEIYIILEDPKAKELESKLYGRT